MNWVKLNYDRFLLALFAVILLVCAGLLFNNARTFGAVFEPTRVIPHEGDKINQPQQAAVEKSQKELKDPQQWGARMINGRRLPLFVSVPYIAKGDQLVDPLSGDVDLHPPVKNSWLIDNKQDLLSPNVLEQDSDGDGFTTLDEYNGHTDPMNKNDHPPYYTKMSLDHLVRQAFRLRFEAKNGDTIQINIVDAPDAPTVFTKVGKMVGDTPYKVLKFEAKTAKDPETKITKDASEVTVQNTINGEQVILPKQKDVDSPTTYAVINYGWTGKQFGVKKDAEFTLKPEDNVKYKCVELVGDTDVVIVRETDNKRIVVTKSGIKP